MTTEPGGPEAAVRALWAALDRRDWDAVAGCLAEDCVYLDVPTGPTTAARGPADIVTRLRLGLADLAAYENHDGVLLAGADGSVMYEHSETWTFASGETVRLPFVSVHRVRDGRVALWKDYWDFGTLAAAAPPDWLESLATADTSWVFDATASPVEP